MWWVGVRKMCPVPCDFRVPLSCPLWTLTAAVGGGQSHKCVDLVAKGNRVDLVPLSSPEPGRGKGFHTESWSWPRELPAVWPCVFISLLCYLFFEKACVHFIGLRCYVSQPQRKKASTQTNSKSCWPTYSPNLRLLSHCVNIAAGWWGSPHS